MEVVVVMNVMVVLLLMVWVIEIVEGFGSRRLRVGKGGYRRRWVAVAVR